jgi:hypothetical protein
LVFSPIRVSSLHLVPYKGFAPKSLPQLGFRPFCLFPYKGFIPSCVPQLGFCVSSLRLFPFRVSSLRGYSSPIRVSSVVQNLRVSASRSPSHALPCTFVEAPNWVCRTPPISSFSFVCEFLLCVPLSLSNFWTVFAVWFCWTILGISQTLALCVFLSLHLEMVRGFPIPWLRHRS